MTAVMQACRRRCMEGIDRGTGRAGQSIYNATAHNRRTPFIREARGEGTLYLPVALGRLRAGGRRHAHPRSLRCRSEPRPTAVE